MDDPILKLIEQAQEILRLAIMATGPDQRLELSRKQERLWGELVTVLEDPPFKRDRVSQLMAYRDWVDALGEFGDQLPATLRERAQLWLEK